MKQDAMFVKKLFGRFFLPALFSSLALAVGAVADSLYVGRSVGESGLFVIGAAYPIYMVFSTLSIGVASGGAVHFAVALGEGKEKKARNVFFSTLFFDFLGIVLLVTAGLILRDPLVSRLSHIFMDTQLLIIAFLRIRTLDKLFEATIALVNFRICN